MVPIGENESFRFGSFGRQDGGDDDDVGRKLAPQTSAGRPRKGPTLFTPQTQTLRTRDVSSRGPKTKERSQKTRREIKANVIIFGVGGFGGVGDIKNELQPRLPI